MAKGGSAPDNSAQVAALQKQQADAQAQADALAQQNLDTTNAKRRQQRGKSLLTATSEFGTADPLGK